MRPLHAACMRTLQVQEIDIHCERSGYEDCGMRIAEELGLNYAFLCEFDELHSPLRDPSSQVWISLSLSLSLTHTHTHTSLSFSLSYSLSLLLSLLLSRYVLCPRAAACTATPSTRNST